MIHLRSLSISLKPGDEAFPFSFPLVRKFSEFRFDSPMTIFVGENGSGKSTILEAMACGIGLPAAGGRPLEQDDTLAHARRLGERMRFAWGKRSHRGFFLRAEDFFNFARRMSETRKELDEMADEFSERFTGLGRMLAVGAARGQSHGISSRYGEDLDANSHGESFLKLFQSRFVPGGLYLLDEPEAPLSPQRQLALLSMLKQMVEEQEGQFVLATHSPILMGYPGASIVSFDSVPPGRVAYEDLEHVQVTRDFLNGREAFLRHL